MDDFAYTYTSNTNKLASIVDVATSTYSMDFDAATSKTFTYNSDGQMTASQAENVSTITYYNTGLTKKVTFANSNTAEYWYDDRGQKIKTKYYDNASAKAKFTWYISDAGGNPLAIYEYDQAMGSPAFTLVEELIYGSGRIGTLDKVTAIIDYEITDHLGNVRATIKGISTGVYELTSRTDYYAFGGAQPGRSYNLNSYRFNYQGQEGAPGTNWQAFDLRMLNSDLGRWFAPDPEGQFHSPYISMANNPVSGIDPDGGYARYYNEGGVKAITQLKQLYEGDDPRYFGKYYTDNDLYNMEANDRLKAWNTAQVWASYGDDGSFANSGSVDHGTFTMHNDDLKALRQSTGSNYDAQELNKIQDCIATGGYIGKDGKEKVLDDNGKLVDKDKFDNIASLVKDGKSDLVDKPRGSDKRDREKRRAQRKANRKGFGVRYFGMFKVYKAHHTGVTGLKKIHGQSNNKKVWKTVAGGRGSAWRRGTRNRNVNVGAGATRVIYQHYPGAAGGDITTATLNGGAAQVSGGGQFTGGGGVLSLGTSAGAGIVNVSVQSQVPSDWRYRVQQQVDVPKWHFWDN